MFSSAFKNILLLAVITIVTHVHGYGDGPPLEACQDMFPSGHGVAAQTDTPPYSLTLNTTTYNPGDTIEVLLNSTVEFMEGALIQVRSVDCSNVAGIGTFQTATGEDFLEPFSCFNTAGSALRHHVHMHVYNRTFYWTAPSTASGHLYIRATIARNKELFWTNVLSEYIRDNSDTSSDVKICDVTISSAHMTSSSLAGFVFVAVVRLLAFVN